MTRELTPMSSEYIHVAYLHQIARESLQIDFVGYRLGGQRPEVLVRGPLSKASSALRRTGVCNASLGVSLAGDSLPGTNQEERTHTPHAYPEQTKENGTSYEDSQTGPAEHSTAQHVGENASHAGSS